MKHFHTLTAIGLLCAVAACTCDDHATKEARAQECRELGLAPGSETFKTCMETKPLNNNDTSNIQQLRNTVRPRSAGAF